MNKCLNCGEPCEEGLNFCCDSCEQEFNGEEIDDDC